MSDFLLWFFLISIHAALCVAAGVIGMLRPDQAHLRANSSAGFQRRQE